VSCFLIGAHIFREVKGGWSRSKCNNRIWPLVHLYGLPYPVWHSSLLMSVRLQQNKMEEYLYML